MFSTTCFVPPNYIIAGTRAGALYRWTIPEKQQDIIDSHPSRPAQKHTGNISVLHYSQSLKLLFSGASDRKVLVWRFDSRSTEISDPIQSLNYFESTPLSIITYMKFLFVLEVRGITVLVQQRVKDSTATHFRKIEFITLKGLEFSSQCFSPNPSVDNSGYLYVSFSNGSITQFDVQLADKPTFTHSSQFKQICDRSIHTINYIPSESVILIFSYDHHMRIFNTRNYRVTNILKNPKNVDFVGGCFEQSTKQYLLADVIGFLYVIEFEDAQRILLQNQLSTHCEGLFPEIHDHFLYMQKEGISLIDINRGTVKVSYNIHNGNAFYINFSYDSAKKQLVTAGDDRFIRFWDLTDYKVRLEHKIPTNLAMLSAYVGVREQPKANIIWIVTGHDEGKLFFFNITDSKHTELPSRHKNSISSISVLYAEMKIMLFSCDYDGYVSIWSIDSILENLSYAAVSLIKFFKASDREILASAGRWVMDSFQFATGGNDKVVKLWHESDTSYVADVLVGHTDSVTSMIYDGFFLITGSEDSTIRIWDSINLVQLYVVQNIHQNAIRSIFILEGESKFASCDCGGLVSIYDYVKKQQIWKVKHSADCKCVCVDAKVGKLYACVKSELIPHEIPVSGLPSLNSNSSLPSLH